MGASCKTSWAGLSTRHCIMSVRLIPVVHRPHEQIRRQRVAKCTVVCNTTGVRVLAAPSRTEVQTVNAANDSPCRQEVPQILDDLEQLLSVLPENIRQRLAVHRDRSNLLEVVLDLGRRPEARFLGGRYEYLRDDETTMEDLQAAEVAVGEFGTDNRAGVPGTLHRISAIRNRKRAIVGLTCRVGRAVRVNPDLLVDILQGDDSILFLGSPGVGKTTVIREICRTLSDDLKKRVVIVDSSNEIGGDGDVPHPAIGSARRMHVADAAQQHHVMIEAVENHMPQVVVVDEIGTEAEALACRTIAERGVRLIGTAHGQVLENLIKNPTLSDLVGGVSSVTLGDEEAKNRGTRKTVLERKAPPTFSVVIEMRERGLWVTHWTQDSVDTLLQGKIPFVLVREHDEDRGTVDKTQVVYDQVPAPAARRTHHSGASLSLPSLDLSESDIQDSMDGTWADRLLDLGDKQAARDAAVLRSLGGQASVLHSPMHSSFAYLSGTPAAAASSGGNRRKRGKRANAKAKK